MSQAGAVAVKTMPLVLVLLLGVGCTQEARLAQKAERGDPQAMYDYAEFLRIRRPHGFHESFPEAMGWYVKAAEAGHVESMASLGRIYELDYRPEAERKSVYWHLEAAKRGNTRAMLRLANAYRFGELGLQIDREKEKYWFGQIEQAEQAEKNNAINAVRQRAEKGDLGAMESMARGHEKRGEWNAALLWYKRAGEAGSTEALMRLTHAYERGELGLAKDSAESDRWFRKWQDVMRAQRGKR